MRAPVSAFLLAVLVLASACTEQTSTAPPTELVVDIDAEPGVKARAQSLQIVVEGARDVSDPTQLARSLVQDIKPLKLPLRVAVLPLFGDAKRRFVLTATALDAQQGLVAQVRLVSGYVADEVHYARILLDDACLDTKCDGTLDTCSNGRCVSAQADAASFSTDPKHPKPVSTAGDAGE